MPPGCILYSFCKGQGKRTERDINSGETLIYLYSLRPRFPRATDRKITGGLFCSRGLHLFVSLYEDRETLRLQRWIGIPLCKLRPWSGVLGSVGHISQPNHGTGFTKPSNPFLCSCPLTTLDNTYDLAHTIQRVV